MPTAACCVLSALLVVVLSAQPAKAIVTSNTGTTPPFSVDGLTINTFIGANRFYQAGYTGTRAIQANIEAAHIWNGHATLNHVTTFVTGTGGEGAIGNHPTAVSHAMGGRVSGDFGPDDPVEMGIAPAAQLWSGAIATLYNPLGSFLLSSASIASTYTPIVKTGVNGLTADVFNSSWSGVDTAVVVGIDGLLNDTGAVGVFSAGNSGAANTVGSPGNGYNSITVGALGSDLSSPAYDTRSGFSSYGPSDFLLATSPTTYDAVFGAFSKRATVDISAPGQNLTLASYDTVGLDEHYYQLDSQGTSFAAPVVAGGASLVVDVGKDLYVASNPGAIDGRTVKAVLLNSADKTAGWDNGQALIAGVVTTDQSLDFEVGAGRINLAAAFDQYVSDDVGGNAGTAGALLAPTSYDGSYLGALDGHTTTIEEVGWDFGQLSDEGALNTYFIDSLLAGGSTLTATLTWFADRISGSDADFSGAQESRFADLNLTVFEFDNLTDRNILSTVGQSISLYNVVEHLTFELPQDGLYGIGVHYRENLWNFDDLVGLDYGLAWKVAVVPEPSSAALLLAAATALSVVWRGRWLKHPASLVATAPQQGQNYDR